ncbi:MAG: molybdopterin molybdotransferase MoeA [Fimbriimonadaceae bacterium]|nr:molybdopterin molybdotransferase MoeA [Fimbriimonadaceae bacterium]
MSELLSYEAFLDAVRPHLAVPTGGEAAALDRAVGRVLSQDVVATEAYPRFDNSAVDGYAVGHASDARAGSRLAVAAAVAAGDAPPEGIARGTCVRILTGAAVPPGTWGIAMQEDVETVADAVVLRAECAEGAHVRRAGDDYHPGAVLLRAGSRVGPGAVAVLAEQGVGTVDVWRRPRVGVLATGAELVDASQEPPPGCLRDSNGPMLAGLSQRYGGEVLGVERCGDTEQATCSALERLCGSNDLVITAGGVSVGDRDHVPAAVESLGEVVAHGVKIKPGKPMLFGRVGPCSVFGLPGNPASAFVGFHLFVREALAAASGCANPRLEWMEIPFLSEREAHGRDEFVRCVWGYRGDRWGAWPAGEQGSFGVRSLAEATCLVRLVAGSTGRSGQLRPTLAVD